MAIQRKKRWPKPVRDRIRNFGIVNTNFNQQFLNTFIKTKYKNIDTPINNICPITQTHFDKNSDIIQINNCKHIFFEKNIIEWFEKNNTCPMCRNNIYNTN